jgi:hypothetical protein
MDKLNMVKKIIITIILIVFLLFIQSYVFSESCSLNVNDNSLKTVTLGCVGEGDIVNCYFSIFNNSDVDSGFNNAVSSCKDEYVNPQGSYSYNDYRSCIEDVIENFVNLENSNSGNQSANQECIAACDQVNDDCEFDCYDDSACLDECDVEYQECIDQCNNTNNSGNSSGNSNYSPIYLEDNLFFDLDNCNYQNVKTNLELITDLSFEMKNQTTELSLSGIDDLLVKERNIDIYVNNSNYLGPATFNFDINNLIIDGDSNVSLGTKSRSDCGNISYEQFMENLKKPVYDEIPLKNSLFLKLNNLVIEENSNSNLNIKTEKISTSCDIGRSGGDVKLDTNNIYNKGLLNVNLISADSGDAKNAYDCHEKNGGNSENAGDVNLNINSVYNLQDINFNILSGNGGDGAKGSSSAVGEGCSLSKKPGWGGDGGNAGNIHFNINNIYNEGLVEKNLISGNGGLGADSGFDGGANSNQADYAEGGNGGSGGSIYFSSLNNDLFNIKNNGQIIFSVLAGNGNNGGDKINRPEEGKAGNGGDGGTIKDIFFDFIENNDYFYLNFVSGSKGVKGENPNPGEDGSHGQTSDLEIDYLINNSSDFSIVLNSKKLNIDNSYTSNISINKIHTASYLPKKLSAHTDFTASSNVNRSININNACYIKEPNTNLEYSAQFISINSANQDVFKGDIQAPEGITPTYSENDSCSVCDYIDFENKDEIFPSNTGHKSNQEYSLFSNHQGSINEGELKIFYSKNNPLFTKIESYNPFLEEELPLYTNKEEISSEYNEKMDIYEYKIKPENLKWYFDGNKDLTDKEIYCYYQNYRIEGEIKLDNGIEKNFNFPFTPIFKYN